MHSQSSLCFWSAVHYLRERPIDQLPAAKKLAHRVARYLPSENTKNNPTLHKVMKALQLCSRMNDPVVASDLLCLKNDCFTLRKSTSLDSREQLIYNLALSTVLEHFLWIKTDPPKQQPKAVPFEDLAKEWIRKGKLK